MQAVILAAGEGFRLRPFTISRPKVMIKIANKPIIAYIAEALIKCGIDEIVIIVGYKKEQIYKYFEDESSGKNIRYVKQPRQLGTAHALGCAKDKIEDDFLVLSGDNLCAPEDIKKLLMPDIGNALLITESRHTSKYGIVSIKDGYLKTIMETPQKDFGTNIINTGIYRFTREIFDIMDEAESLALENRYNLTHIVNLLIEKGRNFRAIKARQWRDIVHPWDLPEINAIALEEATSTKAGIIERGTIIKGKVEIEKDSIIRAGCYIVGPVKIGKGCDIGPYSCIYPSTSIGENVKIEEFSHIGESLIGSDILIGPRANISNSVIGDGTILKTNFTAERGNLQKIKGKRFHNLTNIGAMIGEDCRIYSNVIVKPGIIIGANCKIEPGKIITSDLPNKSIVV